MRFTFEDAASETCHACLSIVKHSYLTIVATLAPQIDRRSILLSESYIR